MCPTVIFCGSLGISAQSTSSARAAFDHCSSSQPSCTFSDGRIHFLEPVADWALSQFERRGIAHQPFFRLEKVDPFKQRAFTSDGEEHPFDVLIAVPAHRGAPVVMQSGIGDDRGFIPTDRHTL